jgi:hypothetical protein
LKLLRNQHVVNTRRTRSVRIYNTRGYVSICDPSAMLRLSPFLFPFEAVHCMLVVLCSSHRPSVALQTWKPKSCHSPLPYVSYSLHQDPFLIPCASYQCLLADIRLLRFNFFSPFLQRIGDWVPHTLVTPMQISPRPTENLSWLIRKSAGPDKLAVITSLVLSHVPCL